MDLKKKLLSSFMAEERIDVHSELYDVHCSQNFENKGFPTKKDEAGNTLLNALLKMTLLFSKA
jgi:hypothetical protein